MATFKPVGPWTQYQRQRDEARRRRRLVTIGVVSGFCLAVLGLALLVYLSGLCR
jgi:hypothetical protein